MRTSLRRRFQVGGNSPRRTKPGGVHIDRETSSSASFAALVVASLVAFLLFSSSGQHVERFDAASLVAASLPQSSRTDRMNEVAPGGPDPLIPRRMVFTYRYNLLARPRDQIPRKELAFYDNVKKTIAAFREEWDDPDAEVVFLDDDACVDIINHTEPELLPLFFKKRGMYKGDICRAAELSERGGYYFDIDMEVIMPFVAPNNVSFVTVWGGIFHEFFQSFIAASAGNAIVRQSMREMLGYLNVTTKRKLRGNIGPITLLMAYDAATKEEREKAVLLKETGGKNIKYTNITQRGQSNGCHWVVHDPLKQHAYFYSRIVGSTRCKK